MLEEIKNPKVARAFNGHEVQVGDLWLWNQALGPKKTLKHYFVILKISDYGAAFGEIQVGFDCFEMETAKICSYSFNDPKSKYKLLARM